MKCVITIDKVVSKIEKPKRSVAWTLLIFLTIDFAGRTRAYIHHASLLVGRYGKKLRPAINDSLNFHCDYSDLESD